MKRLILLACVAFTVFQAAAQTHPTSFFVTGNIGATMRKDDYGSKSRGLQLNTSANFLLNQRWALGLYLNHGRSTTESEVIVTQGTGYNIIHRDAEMKQRTYSVGPQLRYYQPVVNKLFLFAEAQAGYQFETTHITDSYTGYHYSGLIPANPTATPVSSDSEAEHKASSAQVNVSPGLVYLVKPQFGLELKINVLSYNHGLRNSMRPSDESNTSDFKADFSLANSSLGVSFYF